MIPPLPLASILSGWMNLLSKAYSTHQVLEPRVGAEGVEGGPPEDRGVEALPIRFFQPAHCLIPIAEGCIDTRNVGGVRVARIRALLQIIEQPQRFVPSA